MIRAVAAWVGLGLCLTTAVDGRVQAQPMVLAVRHAEKVDRSPNARLSAAGHARARRLVSLLKDAAITQVYVTQVERTRQTAAPLLTARKLSPHVLPADATATDLPKALAALGAEDVALVVNHSDRLPQLWSALGCRGKVEVGSDMYDQLFVMALRRAGPPSCTVVRLDAATP